MLVSLLFYGWFGLRGTIGHLETWTNLATRFGRWLGLMSSDGCQLLGLFVITVLA